MALDSLAWLPPLNACLNATALVCLLVGWIRIRRRDTQGHRRAMLGATAASGVFLVGYVALRFVLASVTGSPSKRFPADAGTLRTVYLAILLTHTVLAASLVWFVPRTLFLALRGRLDEHRRIARWTLPIWLYVSFTGIVVYLMLYPFCPAEPGR